MPTGTGDVHAAAADKEHSGRSGRCCAEDLSGTKIQLIPAGRVAARGVGEVGSVSDTGCHTKRYANGSVRAVQNCRTSDTAQSEAQMWMHSTECCISWSGKHHQASHALAVGGDEPKDTAEGVELGHLRQVNAMGEVGGRAAEGGGGSGEKRQKAGEK